MKTSKIQITYEQFDEMIRGYAIAELIVNYSMELEDLKTKKRNQLLKIYEII